MKYFSKDKISDIWKFVTLLFGWQLCLIKLLFTTLLLESACKNAPFVTHSACLVENILQN